MNFAKAAGVGTTFGTAIVLVLSLLSSGCSESRECLKWTTTLMPNTTCTSYDNGQCRGWSYGTKQVRMCEKYADPKPASKSEGKKSEAKQ